MSSLLLDALRYESLGDDLRQLPLGRIRVYAIKSCVRDIRMLRIEELNDLGPAL